MTREKFAKYVKNLSDYELYLLAKKNISTHSADVNGLDWHNEIIYAECQNRHPDIYASAVNDAGLIMAAKKAGSSLDVSDVLRPSLMSRVELANFIGGSRINDTLRNSIPFDTVVSEISSGGSDKYLFCKVSGDSMTGAYIYDDDILLVDKNYENADGKIIVAAVNDILFVKRYQNRNGKQLLLSENEQYEPFEITPDVDFKILGLVKMIMHSID